MLSKVAARVFELAGLVGIVYGLALIWVPLGLIGGGLTLIVAAYRLDSPQSGAASGDAPS